MASAETAGSNGEALSAPSHRPFNPRAGAELTGTGVWFRLFAPAFRDSEKPVELIVVGAPAPLPMHSHGDGWFELFYPEARAGTLYNFTLPDGRVVADPASRFQPQDLAGPSEVFDPGSYLWQDNEWHGRPWEEAVLYELHVGSFTPEGTFEAAIGKLDHLAATGITAIELMCLADFPGTRSWGYDGVLFFAPDSAYGRPEHLKAFIDAAHARGLMVVLDVVFNHFGPQGNQLPSYFPQIFSQEHKTAWGSGLNFDGPGCSEVREFILANALYWIEEFHVDGLRLDAAHEMHDNSPRHILDELAARLHAYGDAQTPPRRLHLILESDDTSGQRLMRSKDSDAPSYTAQWNHAIDHLLGAAMGGECSAHDPENTHEIEEIGKALSEGFLGDALNCKAPGTDVRVPPTAFVSFIQTHDLIGNRPFGDRVHRLGTPEAVRAITSVVLLAPQVPMLFMGEEWAASTPFPYFCDFSGELAEAVRKGRCENMAKSGQLSDEELKRVPDPGAASTFRSAQLRWEELEQEPHHGHLDWYRRVLAARHEHVVPYLHSLAEACGQYNVLGPASATVRWQLQTATLHLAVNFCHSPSPEFLPQGRVFWCEGSESAADDGRIRLGPWSVRWSLQAEESTPTHENG